MNEVKNFLQNRYCGIVTDSGDTAWSSAQVFSILDVVLEKKWMVLGGDVYTNAGISTCDNWYYTPDPMMPLLSNVDKSVEVCRRYISNFTKRNGESYLYSLVISNSYVEAFL